jgi:hypothetical protein
MVMLTRGRQRIVALLTLLGAFLRTLSGFSIPEADHDDEIEQGEVTDWVYAMAAVDQAPPAPSMPIGNRFVSAWPQEEPQRWVQTWHGSPAVMLLGNGPVADPRDFRIA